ncbi:MAG TPA: TolC family protein [Myxococcota bacterium]|nr:TolC family protein [Myxococcota bacterium]
MNRSVRLLVSLVTALALSVGGASAQVEDLQVPGAVVGTDDLGMESEAAVRRPLGIEEAVALSLANNLEVEVERFAPLIAGTEEQGAWGAYDPRLAADFSYDVRKSPNTFSLNAAPFNIDRERGGGVGIEQLIPYIGASLGIRYEASDRTTNSTLQALDPQFDTSVFLTARIPLARDLIWNEPWTQVKVRASQYRASRESFRSLIMDTTQSTVDTYWGLVAASEQVRVARKSLETARALLEQVKTQYEVGVVSQVEVVEAEAGVAGREFDLINAANEYRNVQDRLIDRVLGADLDATTELQLVPTEDAQAYRIRTIDVGEAVSVAFRQRPELRVADRQIEQGELDLKFARNQRLPEFDVEVRYGFVGITGEGNPDLQFGTPSDAGDFGDSHDDFFQPDGADNLRVTGTFSIPFPNTTARKRVSRSQLELRRSQTRKLRTEQQIILDVREAARTLRASEEGIEAAERRRLAAEEQLRAERIRLEHGESTPFEVLQRESDLVEAESQKIEALRSYREAETALERSQGTILDFYKVRLEEAWQPSREARAARW